VFNDIMDNDLTVIDMYDVRMCFVDCEMLECGFCYFTIYFFGFSDNLVGEY
jgi:hypothetical protein